MKKLMMGCSVILLLAAGCHQDELPSVYQPGANFLPLKVDQYFIYKVDSTSIYFQVETTKHYEVMHVITDSVKTEDGYFTYIIERSMRVNESAPWVAMPTWQARLTEREAVIQEGNISFVKLVFPLSVNLTWNGNQLNKLKGPDNCGDDPLYPCDKYLVSELQQPTAISTGLQFDDTVLVEENNDPDLIAIFNVSKSRYAKGVGLVEREITYLIYCSDDEDCLGKQQIQQGLEYKAVLKEYGTR